MAKSGITRVTVLGAGVLGAQIAFQAAYAGFTVTSYDINDEALAAARKRFDTLEKNYIHDLEDATEETVAQARDRLSLTADLAEAVQEADLVIEAIPELLDLKKKVWAEVGAAAPDSAIFVTNTSTLTPSDFAEATGRPNRFLALHFANSIWTHPTAEVMPHAGTDEDAFDRVAAYASEMGMVPILLKKEQPAYVLNSLLVPFLGAARKLLINGVAEPAEIDKDWKISTGAPQGPFELMDIIGMRTLRMISANEAAEGDEVAEKFVKLLDEEYISKGKIGRESGEGFYRYD